MSAHQNTVVCVGFARDTSQLVTITTEGETRVVSMNRNFTPSRLWSTCRQINELCARARACEREGVGRGRAETVGRAAVK